MGKLRKEIKATAKQKREYLQQTKNRLKAIQGPTKEERVKLYPPDHWSDTMDSFWLCNECGQQVRIEDNHFHPVTVGVEINK